MRYKIKKENNSKEIEKSLEKNGEFVPSFHNWIGLDEQKKIAEKLEKITKKEK